LSVFGLNHVNAIDVDAGLGKGVGITVDFS
jgi:hypothetical protein